MIPQWLMAGIWGLVAGSALVIGALVGYFSKISQRWIAAIMSFGSGVLISALSFDLMDEAYKRGGFDSTAIGFLSGEQLFTLQQTFYYRRKVQSIVNAQITSSLRRKKIKEAEWL